MVSYINPFANLEQDCYYDKTIDDVHVEVGSSNRVVDGFRNFLSIPTKLIFWNRNVNSGGVSEETIQKMKEYLDENNLHDVHVSVNQYKPQDIWKRTFTNPKTSLFSKMTLGISNSILMTIFIPKLTGLVGDHYNPLSNTIHLFSNDPSIALHECGHAKDFNSRKNPVLYALTSKPPYIGSIATLMQEAIATNNAWQYLSAKNDKELLSHSYKVLVPAFASYVAAAVLPDINSLSLQALNCDLPLGNCGTALDEFKFAWKTYIVGFTGILLAGHVLGRVMAASVEKGKEDQTEKAPLESVSLN